MEGGSGVSCKLSLGTQWHCGHRSPIQSSLLSLSEPFSTDYVNYAMRAYRDICYLLINIPSLYVGVICTHVCNNNKISHFCNKSFTVKLRPQKSHLLLFLKSHTSHLAATRGAASYPGTGMSVVPVQLSSCPVASLLHDRPLESTSVDFQLTFVNTDVADLRSKGKS